MPVTVFIETPARAVSFVFPAGIAGCVGSAKIYWNIASLLIGIQAWPCSARTNQGQDEQRVFKGEAELNRWVQIFSSGFAEVMGGVCHLPFQDWG